MKSKSILLKSVICGSAYLIFTLMLLFLVYIIRFFESAFILGISYGIIVMLVTSCEKIERTIIARVLGIVSAVIAQLILFITGIPYKIILYILRDDEWVKETGRLTVNEVIGYNWGVMFFWWAFIMSFLISISCLFVFNMIKNRRKKHTARR